MFFLSVSGRSFYLLKKINTDDSEDLRSAIMHPLGLERVVHVVVTFRTSRSTDGSARMALSNAIAFRYLLSSNFGFNLIFT